MKSFFERIAKNFGGEEPQPEPESPPLDLFWGA
ncbi:hypothetical protein CCHR01_08194 [Colletotrichum chrysophilum]|uniref:Uncharacterized protein n=1 Tax=Colletotrichum chrysophilum TaxID=1836956 RepID=A0AAD9ELP0_9PEZI|nr:hypothetical protein CCHR01_08194 [Colletotrichum chrysophilum]